MKKLPIEEKAKRYDEALDNAKVVYKTIRKDLKPVIEQIFPELEESDDRIRKAIIKCLKWLRDEARWTDIYGISFDSIFAWLEKQGEQVLPATNEHAWLYLVSDVLTWKDGIGQYLDDPRVQELAKKIRNEYAQKLIEY